MLHIVCSESYREGEHMPVRGLIFRIPVILIISAPEMPMQDIQDVF
jgi:hypothetical protein